ncbi:MAG: hypothetical protein KA140_06385 [Caldisericia bacterium]|nr:hypothetical protein [Caldisericia bacterium]
MIKRVTWISWVALALMVVGVVGVILIFLVKVTPPISDKIIDYENVFNLPLAMLSSCAFIIFLVKAKKMHPIDKRPWLSFSIASFFYLSSIVLWLFRFGLDSVNAQIFDRIIPSGISLICLIAAIIAICFGFIAETLTSARNLPLSAYVGPLVASFIAIYLLGSLLGSFLPIAKILEIVIGYSIPSILCIYVINSIGKEEPKAICYKVLLAGFMASTVIVVICYLFKTDVHEPIWVIINLFCVVVAADIRTNIWISEQK